MLTQTQQRKLLPLRNQDILILGAAREGLSTYHFLRQAFPEKLLTVVDIAPLSKLNHEWKDALANDPYLVGQFGKHYLSQLEKFTYIFKTPAISPFFPPIIAARERGVTISSNMEWFLRLARGTTIGITGTKGKSTTSASIAHLLQTAGKKTLLLGNIGTAALNYLDQTDSKTFSVLELSAHQLRDLKQSPNIAVVQKITTEHLDYFGNLANYIEAKTPIVRYQKPTDLLIYCDEFPNSRYFATLTAAQKRAFGLKAAPNHTAFISGRAIMIQRGKLNESVFDLKKLKLLGKHNLYNILPTVVLADYLKISNQQLSQALATFNPLRHRLEYVETVNDVSYYNDSLSTTPQAAVAALQTFAHHSLVLLAGGFDRKQDFSQLAHKIITSNVRALILFPDTGKRIKRAVIDAAISKKTTPPQFYAVLTMREAVQTAARLAQPGDIVLMSPGSASFGIFDNYADRGDQFCQNVKNLV